jgi:hypothetical protein
VIERQDQETTKFGVPKHSDLDDEAKNTKETNSGVGEPIELNHS